MGHHAPFDGSLSGSHWRNIQTQTKTDTISLLFLYIFLRYFHPYRISLFKYLLHVISFITLRHSLRRLRTTINGSKWQQSYCRQNTNLLVLIFCNPFLLCLFFYSLILFRFNTLYLMHFSNWLILIFFFKRWLFKSNSRSHVAFFLFIMIFYDCTHNCYISFLFRNKSKHVEIRFIMFFHMLFQQPSTLMMHAT